jgi:hypothetical protein
MKATTGRPAHTKLDRHMLDGGAGSESRAAHVDWPVLPQFQSPAANVHERVRVCDKRHFNFQPR